VDIFWGPGFVVANWVYFALTPDGSPARKWLISILVTIWGLRLGSYILWRNWGKPEDFRYQKWREEEGARWWWFSFFKVFLLQGMLAWIISAPLLAAHAGGGSARPGVLDYIAILVWVIGFFFEAVGDLQMARFKANPANKGKVLDRGVWRYTRHPNYFGDATQWWAYYLIAAAAGGFWTIFSPILMTLLLLRVSGVALLEKTLKETKPQYKEYVESTSAFVPWFPRRGE
jgi:steroid 5-alpha reductase family enzyme